MIRKMNKRERQGVREGNRGRGESRRRRFIYRPRENVSGGWHDFSAIFDR